MISAILLSHNSNETKECIKSLETNNNISEVIIVNKVQNKYEYKSYKFEIKNINNDVFQYSFSKLCNIGIRNASKENDLLILNDNCYLVKNSLDNLEKALYSNSNIGIVTPISNIGPSHYYQSLDLPFDSFKMYSQFLEGQNEYDESKNELRLSTTFLTTLIKRELIDAIGNFDEKFNTTDYVSDDFSIRALKKGFKTLFCNHSFVYIKDYLNFYMPSIDQIKFKEKWGFDPFHSLSIKNEILDKLAIDKSKKVSILEIGCDCGSTLLKLKSIYKDCDLYGINNDENSIEIAKHIDGAIVRNVNVESDEVVFEEEQFDLIIALDVLEHLKDPWKLLEKLKKSLKKDGQIIVSIPNIMHISIINSLIQGVWDYQDSGIFDKTHLRFFTLKTIKESFESIGFDLIYYFSTFATLSPEESNLIELLSTQYPLDKNQLMSYQYIITNKI